MSVFITSFQNDTIYTYTPYGGGTDGNNTLFSHSFSYEILDGRAGDDTLYSSTHGTNVLNGGAGFDTAAYDNSTAGFLGIRPNYNLNGTLRDITVYHLTTQGVIHRNGAIYTRLDLLTGIEVIRTADGVFPLETALAQAFNVSAYEYGDDNLRLAAPYSGLLPLDTQLVTGTANEHIVGTARRDFINASAGNDTVDGRDGDDLLVGSTGNDILIGGAGTDTAQFSGAQQDYRIGIQGDRVLVSGLDGYDDLSQIEWLQFGEGAPITVESLGQSLDSQELVAVLTNGTPHFLLPQAYTGPLALAYQFTGTDASDVLSGTTRNDFVYLGTGDDAANMGAGDDIADGGTGSNFLTGGTGRDVFFIDGRSHLAVWSCITDFEAGEELALWGWQPGTSTGTWGEDGGVAGYTGATFYADIDGNGLVETAITLTGRSLAQTPIATEQNGLLWFR